MANAKLKIENREKDLNPRQIRSKGFLTGSLYGKDMDAKSIQINAHEFELAYRDNKNGFWELSLGSEKFNAKIQELQLDYSTNKFLNVEFALA